VRFYYLSKKFHNTIVDLDLSSNYKLKEVLYMRIAICDDEVSQINVMENYLDILKPTYENNCYDSFMSGDDLIREYSNQNNPYDVIFLDMEMDGLNGIETAKKIRVSDEKALIVYITSHKEYVYDSFEVSPFRFLIKPVSFEEFKNILSLVHQKFLKNSKPFYFTTSGVRNCVSYDEIFYFESNKRKVIINTKEKEYEFYGKLETIYEVLKEYDFIFIHKSYIVNMNYIKEIEYENLKLCNGKMLPISESRRKMVRNEHLNFLMRSYNI